MYTIKSESEEGIRYMLPSRYEKQGLLWVRPEWANAFTFYKSAKIAAAAWNKRMENPWFAELYGNDKLSLVRV